MVSQNQMSRRDLLRLLGVIGMGLGVFISIIAFVMPSACTFIGGLQMVFAIPLFFGGLVVFIIGLFFRRSKGSTEPPSEGSAW